MARPCLSTKVTHPDTVSRRHKKPPSHLHESTERCAYTDNSGGGGMGSLHTTITEEDREDNLCLQPYST